MVVESKVEKMRGNQKVWSEILSIGYFSHAAKHHVLAFLLTYKYLSNEKILLRDIHVFPFAGL